MPPAPSAQMAPVPPKHEQVRRRGLAAGLLGWGRSGASSWLAEPRETGCNHPQHPPTHPPAPQAELPEEDMETRGGGQAHEERRQQRDDDVRRGAGRGQGAAGMLV